MKKYLLLLLLIASGQLFAQNKWGIATYTVPFGWNSTEQGTSLVLEKGKSKEGVCKISISGTERLAVNTAADYIQQRTARNSTNARYNPSQKQVVRTVLDGMTGFSSGASSLVNEMEVTVWFYSFTNGTETFFVELISGGKGCTDEINQFLTKLQMDTAPEPTSGNTRAKAKRARKAAPAAPAAPAPMM